MNAVTLKPTQCALWLRARDPQAEEGVFFRWFNAVYEPLERRYVRLIRFMVERSGRMAAIALVLIGLAGWGLTRVPTGFIPTEDQGYVMVTVQLPDGASLERTEKVMDELARICRENPALERTISIGGLSPLDNNASLANAGIIYLMFKDWSERGKGEDLLSHLRGPLGAARPVPGRAHDGARAAADPGPRALRRLPDAGRADRRQRGLRPAAAGRRRASSARAKADPAIRMALTPFRASGAADRRSTSTRRRPRTWASTSATSTTRCRRTWARASSTCSRASATSTWSTRRRTRRSGARPAASPATTSARAAARWCRSARVARLEKTQGPAVITLYNLYPSATINGAANAAFSSGQAMQTMERIAARDAARRG